MANTIKLKRSSTASAAPTTGDLALGELAINTYDGKVYLKKDDGTESIVEIGSGGGGASTLGDLSDVTVTSPSSTTVGDFLKYTGSGWENVDLSYANGSAPGIVSGAEQIFEGRKKLWGGGEIKAPYDNQVALFLKPYNSSQSAALLEVQDINNSTTLTISTAGNISANDITATRYIEKSANAFSTSLTPSAGSLSIDTTSGNVVLGALSASVTEWAFTNVATTYSRVTTIAVIIDGNTSYTYGSSCSVNGTSVTGGVLWTDGVAPTATSGTDILSFIIVKDSAGTIKVFGSANGEATFSLNGLSDATISSATSGDTLVYNGSSWVNDSTLSVDTATSVASATGSLKSIAGSASTVPLISKGATSQTGDLFQAQNSSGTVLAKIDASGNIDSNKVTISPSATGTLLDGVFASGTSGKIVDIKDSSNNEVFTVRDDGFLGINSASSSMAGSPLLQVKKQGGSGDCRIGIESTIADGQTSSLIIVGNANSSDRISALGVIKHSGITNACSYILLDRENNSNSYLWVDNSMNLRVSSSTSHIGTTSGVIVGTQTSDARLKNLNPDGFNYSLQSVLNLNPVKYKLNDDPDQADKLGFLAQEIRSVIPESVYDTKEEIEGEDPTQTKLAMDYSQLIPVLVKSIQELKAEKDALEARVVALENA